MKKTIEESPHKDNPLLNKYLSRNNVNRQLLAEKLKFLRKYRDIHRKNLNPLKANAIDNIARALTTTPSSDSTLRKMISTPLKDFSKEEKNNMFTYLPKKTIIPANRLNSVLEKFNQSDASPNRINRFLTKDDVIKKIEYARRFNDLVPVDHDTFEIFKQKPRVAAVKREPSPLLNYLKTPTNKLHFY